MEKYVVLSPTHGIPPDAVVSLPRGVRLSSLDECSRPDFTVWGEFFSKEQLRWLAGVTHWLNYQPTPSGPDGTAEFEARKVVLRTAIGLQIVSPTGTWGKDRLVVVCGFHGERLDPTSMSRHSPLYSTRWGCRSRRVGSDPDLPLPVVTGVHAVEEQNVARLYNSTGLFMLGLEVNHTYMSILMWVAGLDSLLMAGEKKVFVRRICNLLGSGAFVFPRDVIGDQPRYTVREVAGDVWDLRNEVAHGHEIPQKFWSRVPFEDVNGQNLACDESTYTRLDLLSECALFLLRGCLLRVFTDYNIGVPRVGDTKGWRAILDNRGA